jgi:hypothetical protein
MKGLNKAKYSALVLLLLLISVMFAVASVKAQDQPIETIPPEQYPSVPNPYNPPSPPPAPQEVATVVVAASVGGTTNPEPGVYKYNYAATITLEATPSSGFRFLYWTIRGSYTPGHNQPPINYPENAAEDPNWVPTFPSPSQVAEDSLVLSTNPLQIICGYGYTYVYEPVFAPTTAPPATSDAIVNVLDSIGGNTNPTPGTYYYRNGSTINLQATPDSGYTFQYWVAVGEDGHPTTITDNPTNINCGYGYTYSYQAMFAPSEATPASTGIPAEYLYAIIIVLAIIAAIGIGAALMYRSKGK